MKEETFAVRLKKAMIKKGMKQIDLVNKTKLDKSLISNYLAGKYEAGQWNLTKLAEALDTNEVWLMGYDVQYEPYDRIIEQKYSLEELENIVVSQKLVEDTNKNWNDKLKKDHLDLYNILNKDSKESVKIPILGKIPAGIAIEAVEDIIGYEKIPLEWTLGNREYFGLKIDGNSMEPDYKNGDTVIFLKSSDCESGKDCAVIVDNQDAVFKKVCKQNNGIILRPINPEYEAKFYSYEDIEKLPLSILGVAKEIRRKVI